VEEVMVRDWGGRMKIKQPGVMVHVYNPSRGACNQEFKTSRVHRPSFKTTRTKKNRFKCQPLSSEKKRVKKLIIYHGRFLRRLEKSESKIQGKDWLFRR
jgi:hypothetical protein